MAERMVHRGPDEEGFHVAAGVGLAFRRLRVLDLETGSQPQSNEDGSIRVVFNGEIYNHAELRAQLEARGHRFRTRSDTEVLVHLYEEHGADLVDRLNGMFAFAIWDERDRSLLLARDHVGIKPLLWARVDEGLAFASEVGPLLECPGLDTQIDPVALHQFLSWGTIAAPRTLRRGIRRLPPAHRLVWRDGDVRVHRYWHPLVEAAETPHSYDDACRELRALLEDSVRLQRTADVPLGAFLSGGIDSTVLVGLLAKQIGTARTFSIGFRGSPVFDETRWARAAAAHHRSEHTETQVHPDEVRRAIPDVLDRLDEPFGSASILPAWMVAREARRGMTVALSGDGADELFAGYEKYLGEALHERWNRLPTALRRSATAACRSLPAHRATRRGDFGRKLRRFVDGAHEDAAVRHDGWMRLASAETVSRLLGEGAIRNPGLEIVRGLHEDYARHGGADPLNRALFTDLSLALPSDMLAKVDQASMLHSLEVRVPYLDRRIVAFALSLPGDWKMRGLRRKRVLRDSAADLLPSSVRRRGKAGFDVPIGEWIKSDLSGLFRDVVEQRDGIPLDHTTLDQLFREHVDGRADRSKILWAVFALRWWESRGEPAASRAVAPAFVAAA
jgi:asparagine synthase (glutamine-hydrolysing)